MKHRVIPPNWQTRFPLFLALVTVLAPLFLSGLAAEGARVYWTNGMGIHRVESNGGIQETVLPVTLVMPESIAIDAVQGKIYWIDGAVIRPAPGRILRANLDGTGVEVIVARAGFDTPVDIAVDAVGGKVYWADWQVGAIQRANLDGTNVEDIARGQVSSIAVDAVGGKIYWTGQGIHRANLDGTAVEEIVTVAAAYGIAVDPVAGKIYWVIPETPQSPAKIQRANLNGTNIEELLTGMPFSALDTTHGKIYRVEAKYDAETRQRSATIWRVNLDGTALEEIVQIEGFTPAGIAIDAASGKLYWTLPNGKIQRANLDGAEVEDIVTAVVKIPEYIAIDGVNGKIYWTEPFFSKIVRADLAGAEVEDIVTGVYARAIAIDAVGRKIYWTNASAKKIQRANFDGTDLEDIAPIDSVFAFSIAIDSSDGKVYWTERVFDVPNRRFINRIRQSNLNGTNARDLFDLRVEDIAIDEANRKIYFAAHNIQRANLDGTDLEDVLMGINALNIAIDAVDGKLYWTSGTGAIQRANLDGTAVETIFTDAFANFIALDLTSSRTFSFEMSVPKGISFIHLPLKVAAINNQPMTINTIADLYDALGGTENVNFIVTRDASAGVWRSYLGQQSRGTSSDMTITDEIGILTSMKHPVTLRLEGDALGSSAASQIRLSPGINFVGVPLKDGRLQRVSDLLSLDGFRGNANTIIVVDDGQFKVVAQPGDEGDIPLTGGQSFIVIARAAGVAQITGSAWENVRESPSAAPPMPIVGYPIDDRTPVLAPTAIVAQLAIEDLWRHIRSTAYIRQPRLLADRIPTETKLLPNFPNPFNPETWIPFRLAEDATVTLSIYDNRGQVVRTVALGHRRAGFYESNDKAIYWDGRNDKGEPVASGIYFYTLTAKTAVPPTTYTETRKMLSVK